MGGEDPRLVRQAQELLVEGLVEETTERLRVQPGGARCEQVRSTDIADEERVAGQYPVRRGVVRPLVDDHTDRLGGVAWRGPDLEPDITELESLAVAERLDREVDVRRLAERDDSSGRRRELEVPREEVGMEMGLDDSLDAEALFVGLLEVHADVASRVDDDRTPRRLVADQV